MHFAGLTKYADRPQPRARTTDRVLVTHRRTLRGLLRGRRSQGVGTPVALSCTSGTAAANYTPAVIEAREARVPLIVLTADRPPELRDVGAGQTIDQLALYGANVKWFFEVGVHDATPERLRWIRMLACRAYWTATGDEAGPVHLNFPLREPLVLDRLGEEPGGGGRAGGEPWVRTHREVLIGHRARRRVELPIPATSPHTR